MPSTENCCRNANAEMWAAVKQLFGCWIVITEEWNVWNVYGMFVIYFVWSCPSAVCTQDCMWKLWTILASGFWRRSFQIFCSMLQSLPISHHFRDCNLAFTQFARCLSRLCVFLAAFCCCLGAKILLVKLPVQTIKIMEHNLQIQDT